MFEASARAKINLTLEVLGRREDGYHQVKTILQTVDLADRLEFDDSANLRVECDLPGANGADDLVWTAATALAAYCGITPQARIVIKKGIPVSMGLGGGSSDAAAALIALNQFWELGLSQEALAGIAAEIGSDVAFFLTGVTLICPAVAIARKTAAMYSLLNPSHYSDGGVTGRMIEILVGGQFVAESVGGMTHNIFEQVIRQAVPELNGLLGRLEGIFQNPLRLAGSGPGMYSLPSNEDEYQAAANALQPYGVGVYLVCTTASKT